MSEIRTRAIASLAILKVNWDQGRDYIQNFVPFIAEALRSTDAEVVSIPEIQSKIAELFALHIPQGALKTILKRAVRANYAVREHSVYRVVKTRIVETRFNEIRDAVTYEYELFIEDFKSYCVREFGVEVSDDIAERVLEEYLAKGSIDLLMPALRRRPVAISVHEDITTESPYEYLLQRFISEACQKQSRAFEFLVTIVRGRMLADVLYFPTLGSATQRFGRVRVYLDTTLLLRALGLSDIHFQTPCRELLEILYEAGLSLFCFSHTYDEILGILQGGAKRLREDSIADTHGETLRYFLSKGYSASDVELETAQLQKHLNSLHVRVERKPRYEVPLGIDERKLEVALFDMVHHRHTQALQRDVDSLAAVYRWRRGRLHVPLENCGAIFVTTNSAIAWASTSFFREEYGRSITPLCLSEHVMTTLVWLKKPSRVPDLPEKRLIADSYAAMNPTDDLWKKYANEIERLRARKDITSDDYYVLRSSMEAQSALMDLTSGEPDAFTEGTAQQVLERAKEALVADERGLREAAEAQALAARKRAKELEQHIVGTTLARNARIEKTASVLAKWFTGALLALTFALLALATYVALPKPLSSATQQWPRSVVALLIILLAVLGLANMFTGTSVRSSIRRLEIGLSCLFRKILRRIAGPPTEITG